VHSKVGTRSIRARAWPSLCTYTHARVQSTRPCNTKHTRSNQACARTSLYTYAQACMKDTRPCDTERMCALKSRRAQHSRTRMPLPMHIHPCASARHKALQHKAHARTQKQARAATTRARVLPSTHTRTRAKKDTRPCHTKRMCALEIRHAQHTHTCMPLPMHIHPRASARPRWLGTVHTEHCASRTRIPRAYKTQDNWKRTTGHTTKQHGRHIRLWTQYNQALIRTCRKQKNEVHAILKW
jgi:hypothetical protein